MSSVKDSAQRDSSIGSAVSSGSCTASEVLGETSSDRLESTLSKSQSHQQLRGRWIQPRLITTVVAILLLATAALIQFSLSGGDGAAESQPDESGSPLPVRLTRVGSVTGQAFTQRYAGLLVPKRESALSFERGGRVTKISAREGDMVKRGDLLAELDQEDLDAAKDRTQGELDAAKALLAELVAGPRKQTIEAARARVEELAAKVELAHIDAKRQKQLAPQGATSQSELDSATLGLQAAENGLLAAQALLGELSEGTRKEQIAAQRAKCSAIEASLREIQSRRNDSRIISPFDGYINVRAVDEGVVVSTGQVVLAVVSATQEAQVGLPPSVAKRIRRNDQVNVWMHSKQRVAWVDRLEPTVRRETRTRVVYLRFSPDRRIDDPSTIEAMMDGGWVSGEVIEMQPPGSLKESSSDDSAFWLPRSALVRGARGLWTVLVLPGDAESGTCERRAVEILKTDGSTALVQGMIQRNDRVISSGLHRITAGMQVTDAGASTFSATLSSSGNE